VFADWLEEHGEEERAEFIRVSCEWWRLGRKCQSPVKQGTLAEHPVLSDCGKCRVCILGKRMDDLWAPENWAPLPELEDGRWNPIYRRGFVHSITLTCADWLTHRETLLKVVPLEKVTLTNLPHFSPQDAYTLHRGQSLYLNNEVGDVMDLSFPASNLTTPSR